MFETATLSYGPPAKRVWATAMGFTGQAMLIGCALLAPLISPQTIGRAFLVTALAPPGVPPPPPPLGSRVVPRSSHVAATQFTRHLLTAPIRIPAIAAILIDNPPEAADSGTGVPGGMPGGVRDGASGGIIGSILDEGTRMAQLVHPPEVANREPVKAAPVPVKPPRITVLRMATPIHKVDPVYPALARQARISGTVELLGVLATDGRIHELKVLRGHPLLINAALDAVRQWIFEPTLLNGQAVEVAAPITVNFILNQ
jgi:periplasmic protein TonB